MSLISCEKDELQGQSDNLLISRFQPLAALPGDTITIVGEGFDPVSIKNVVQFNGSSQSARIIGGDNVGTQLYVQVPSDAQPGNVKVASGMFSTLSALPFLLSPSIGSVNPEGALPGEEIAISGRNFPLDLSRLLIYIGETAVDSIFGGSTTQIIFPLPDGLPIGKTSIRVGTRLTDTDSVLSPPIDFTVFDPQQPVLTVLDGNRGTPGQLFTIQGNAFKPAPGKTVVLFGTTEVTSEDFVSISANQIVLNVPAGYPPGPVDVAVKVITNEGEDLISAPLTFTVIEPANIEFYYTAINEPGGASRQQDDSLYKATPIPGVGVVKARIDRTGLGFDVDPSSNKIYFADGNGVNIISLDNTSEKQIIGQGEIFTLSDMAFSASTNKVFYAVRENGLYSYDLGSSVESAQLDPFQEIFNIKNEDDGLYWIGKAIFGASNLIKVTNKVTGNSSEVFSGEPGAGRQWVALAVGNDKIYYVEGPTSPIAFTNTSGSSTIYAINKDGSGSATALYTFNNTIITDLELSNDGGTLYFMVSSEQGAIKSAPVTPDPAAIRDEVPGIRNGRYLDVVQR